MFDSIYLNNELGQKQIVYAIWFWSNLVVLKMPPNCNLWNFQFHLKKIDKTKSNTKNQTKCGTHLDIPLMDAIDPFRKWLSWGHWLCKVVALDTTSC